ncbi:hypothetical protein NXC12_PD00007 (plasmid) [Rhizobium etli]|uniref:Uncharacterized protein n=1 Tax=Rhizobium etli TaxID=29449 RepID=A0AAN1EML7_RHIET|nr:hypothetical protein [Rhizobium etli]ARQ13120.1 hypothetical protein NXC12_PD00007 [Rhizobium etli]
MKSAKRPPITEEQSRQIVYMRVDRSLTAGQIAGKLGLSHGAVTWHLLKLGVEKGGVAPEGYKPKPPSLYTYTRNGYPVRGYTSEDDRQLQKLSMQGLKHSEIARQLGRKSNSVRGRLFTLARRDERREEITAAKSALAQPKQEG